MSCQIYEQYETGMMNDADFQIHLQNCRECRQTMDADARLMEIASSLKEEVNTAGLWSRIEHDLAAEKAAKSSGQFRYSGKWVLRIAAVFVVAVILSWQMFGKSQVGYDDLLAESALKKVEKIEKEYEKAIQKLEEKSTRNLRKMDLELALLYRDRLETIDAQIQRCREALDENPANGHIRRYMLAALQDKKETLREVLALKV